MIPLTLPSPMRADPTSDTEDVYRIATKLEISAQDATIDTEEDDLFRDQDDVIEELSAHDPGSNLISRTATIQDGLPSPLSASPANLAECFDSALQPVHMLSGAEERYLREQLPDSWCLEQFVNYLLVHDDIPYPVTVSRYVQFRWDNLLRAAVSRNIGASNARKLIARVPADHQALEQMLAFVQAKLDDKNRSSELIQQMNPSDFALSQYDPHHPSVSLGWPIQPRNWHHPSSTTQISPTATVPFPGYVFPTQQNFDNMRSMCGGMMPQNGFSQNGNSTQNSRYEVAGQEGCDQHWLTLRADSRSTRKLSKAEEIAAAAEAASVTLEASGCLRSTSMISGMDTSSSQNLGHHYSSIHGSAPSSQVLGSHLFPNRHGDRLYGSFPTQMNGPLRFPLWQPNSFDADEDITQRLGMAHAATMNDANGWRLIGPAANGTNGRMVSSIDDIRIIQRSEESTASSSVAPNKDKRFGRSRSPSIQQNDNKRQDDEDESSRWLAGLYIERSRRDNNQRRRNQDEIQQQTKAPSKFGDSNKRGRSPSGVARLSLRDQSKHGKARGNPDECNQSKYEMSDAAGSPAPRKRVRSNTSMSSKMTLEERLKKPLAHWNSYRPTGDRRRQDTERKSDRDESGGREGDRRGSGGAEVERRWNCYRPQRRSTLVSSGDMESAKEKRESSLTRYNSDQIGRNSYRPKEDLSRASSSSLTLRGSDRTSTPEKMKANNSQELSESLSKPIIDQTALLKLASLSAPLTTLTDAITTLEKLAAFPPVPETKTRQETTANIDVSTAAAAAAALIAFAGSLKAAAGQDI